MNVQDMARRVRSWWASLVHGERLDRELDEELRTYFDERVARKIARGMAPAAARRAAQVEADAGMDQIKERVRAVRVGAALAELSTDLRHGWRSLRRVPAFTSAVVLVCALGIGANAAIFSAVKAMLMNPLPYRDPDQLVFVWSNLTSAGFPHAPLAGPELNDLKERSTTLSSIGGIWANSATLTEPGDPEQLRIGLVTANFFNVLGADAALGRVFDDREHTSPAAAAIVLSWELWQRRFGGDSTLVGRSISVNGAPTIVIGVMPADFRLWMPPDAAVPDHLQAWRPFDARISTAPRGQQFLRVVGRLKPGRTVDDANRELSVISDQIAHEFTEYSASAPTFSAVGLHDDAVRGMRPYLAALLGGVFVLLLVCIASVANLLVARAAARKHEYAMRAALGCPRGRLIRYCMLEGVIVGVLAAAVGLLVGRAWLELLVVLRPTSFERLAITRFDSLVVIFTVLLALGSGIAVSFGPLLEALGTDIRGAIQSTERMGRAIRYRLRIACVAAQIAFGTLLVVGAGLLLHALVRAYQADVGFRSTGAITFRVSLTSSRYWQPNAFTTFSRQLQQQLTTLPGVTGVAAISHLPYDEVPNWSTPYRRIDSADGLTREADTRAVTPGLISVLGATLIEGRDFTEDDDATKPYVVIVDDRLAARTWPGDSAIGKHLVGDPRTTGQVGPVATVVGVVKHLRYRDPMREVREQLFYCERQAFRNPMAYVVRTDGPPASLVAPIRQTVSVLDAQLPIYDVRPLSEYSAHARAAGRFAVVIGSSFAALALLLSFAAIYGVIGYAVVCRRREFGVKLALGASPASIVGLIFGEAMRVTSVGLMAGVVASLFVGQYLARDLAGVTANDPAAFAVAILVVPIVTALAVLVPARRAAATSPLEALRAE